MSPPCPRKALLLAARPLQPLVSIVLIAPPALVVLVVYVSLQVPTRMVAHLLVAIIQAAPNPAHPVVLAVLLAVVGMQPYAALVGEQFPKQE